MKGMVNMAHGMDKERQARYDERTNVIMDTHIEGIVNKGASINSIEYNVAVKLIESIKQELIDSYHAKQRKSERDITQEHYASILSCFAVKRIEYTNKNGVFEMKIKIRGMKGIGINRCMVLSVLTSMVCTTFIQYLPEPVEINKRVNLESVLTSMLNHLNK